MFDKKKLKKNSTHSSTKSFLKKTAFNYVHFYLKNYTKQLILALFSVFTAFLAVLSSGYAIRHVIEEGEFNFQNVSMIALVASIFFLGLGSFGRSYYAAWLGERITSDLRQRIFEKLLCLDINFFDTIKAGEVVSKLTTDLTFIQTFIGQSAAVFVRNIGLFFGGFIFMVFTAPWLFMQTIVGIFLILLPILLLAKKVKKMNINVKKARQDYVNIIDEVFNAIKTVQAFVREDFFTYFFSKANQEAFYYEEKRLFIRSFLVMIVIFLTGCFILSITYIGIGQVQSGDLTTGQLVSFVYFALLVGSSLSSFPELIADAQKATASLESLQELENQQSSLFVSLKNKALPTQSRGIVAVHNVSFSYPSNPDYKAIDSLTVSLSPGERLAIVGPSGSGKSTLFSMLLRFYDPQSGNIYIDGIDLKDLDLKELRTAIGIVPQEPDIFSLSIFDNILYGNPDATEQDVNRIIADLKLDELLRTLPHGANTLVGNKGAKLSGGQKQRIAIARALLKKPRILLLDEATSHLDAESEEIIQRVLTSYMRTCTTIVIAHRLSTVLSCDRIAVLKNGKLDSIGTHAELIAQDGLYKKLISLQYSSYT